MYKATVACFLTYKYFLNEFRKPEKMSPVITFNWRAGDAGKFDWLQCPIILLKIYSCVSEQLSNVSEQDGDKRHKCEMQTGLLYSTCQFL